MQLSIKDILLWTLYGVIIAIFVTSVSRIPGLTPVMQLLLSLLSVAGAVLIIMMLERIIRKKQ